MQQRPKGRELRRKLDNIGKEEAEAVTAQSLWNHGYDGLRHENEQLVDKYEELLSLELPPNIINCCSLFCLPSFRRW
ncbi:hypothetical protein B0J15DRAFT_483718 [Fusarium solani]|uniref:Uncharacterized protein n=1 Tax=Fusarium solani TaxID=169388 RepID=A0A9P9R9U9_FUSSL|nr:uncharacterized protein B0J15DRAFT_483718 [Fusarium solani]KAH7270939.1 hypothetical protein B0J15DRAFT_483718 [Fusarium solani]